MECRAAGAAAPLSGVAGVMRKRTGSEAQGVGQRIF